MVTVIDANFALMLSCVVLGLCDRALGVVHCGSSTVWVVYCVGGLCSSTVYTGLIVLD